MSHRRVRGRNALRSDGQRVIRRAPIWQPVGAAPTRMPSELFSPCLLFVRPAGCQMLPKAAKCWLRGAPVELERTVGICGELWRIGRELQVAAPAGCVNWPEARPQPRERGGPIGRWCGAGMRAAAGRKLALLASQSRSSAAGPAPGGRTRARPEAASGAHTRAPLRHLVGVPASNLGATGSSLSSK